MSETTSLVAPAPPVALIAGWRVSDRRSAAALTITDCTPLAKVAVRAPQGGAAARALGVPLGRAARDGAGALVVGSGPGEWLVLATPGTGPDLVARLGGLSPDEFVSVVDLTHGRALVRLTGARSADLLAKLCPVDLSDRAVPDGAALRCPVAQLATDIVRDDVAGARSYLLHVERSSGQYFFDAVREAGAEYGIDVDGFFRSPGL